MSEQWHEPTPKRPIASEEWYERVLEKASTVNPWLPNLLVVVGGTGRRIGSILNLRASDIIAPDKKSAPHGSIRWRRENDKRGYEMQVPINPEVSEALKAQQKLAGAVGEAWLFPGPYDSSKPLSYHRAKVWLQKAERKAGIDHQEHFGWHALRRAWATRRKNLPPKDVAFVGGWKSNKNNDGDLPGLR